MKGMEFLRKLKGMTMQELADAMGVSRQYIDRLEKNKNELPVMRIRQLSKIFGVNESIIDRDLTIEERKRILNSILNENEGYFGVKIENIGIFKNNKNY